MEDQEKANQRGYDRPDQVACWGGVAHLDESWKAQGKDRREERSWQKANILIGIAEIYKYCNLRRIST